MSNIEAVPVTEQQSENPEVPDAEYSFVFCEHIPENAAAISAELQDCDVIAIEYVGFVTPEDREDHNKILTSYISAATTTAEKDKIREDLVARDGAYGLICDVLGKLDNKEAKVAFIDIDGSDPRYKLIWEYVRLTNVYEDALMLGSSISELKDCQSNMIKAEATSIKARESVTIEQLKAMNKDGKKIGVIAGMVHSPVQHALARDYTTSRTFIDTKDTKDGRSGKIQYTYANQAVRTITTGQSEGVDNQLLDRIVLEDMFCLHEVSGDSLPTDKEPDSGTIRSRVLEKMSDAAVKELLAKMDGILLRNSAILDEDARGDVTWVETGPLLQQYASFYSNR